MPRVAEPDMAIVRPAHDVVLVSGSVFMHAASVISVVASPSVMSVTSTMMPTAVVASAMVSSTMMSTTMMAASMMAASMMAAVPFRVRCRHDSKSECCRDGKNETKFLQHFCVPPQRISQEGRECGLNKKGKGIAMADWKVGPALLGLAALESDRASAGGVEAARYHLI
jgi:hypothetical protein